MVIDSILASGFWAVTLGVIVWVFYTAGKAYLDTPLTIRIVPRYCMGTEASLSRSVNDMKQQGELRTEGEIILGFLVLGMDASRS